MHKNPTKPKQPCKSDERQKMRTFRQVRMQVEHQPFQSSFSPEKSENIVSACTSQRNQIYEAHQIRIFLNQCTENTTKFPMLTRVYAFLRLL